MTTRRFILFAFACAILGSGFCWWHFGYRAPRLAFERLLNGNDSVQISSLIIEGQGRRIMVDDPDSMLYLTKCFRSAENDSYKPGLTYYVIVYLSTGGSVRCAMNVSEDQDSISIRFPLDGILRDSATNYVIKLPQSAIPEPLSKTLSELQENKQLQPIAPQNG